MRTKGNAIDGKVIFNDPEAHMRRIREERRLERLSEGGAVVSTVPQSTQRHGSRFCLATACMQRLLR